MAKQQQTTKERILQAAQEEFSDKGLDGARVDEIARRAGANKERIYACVGSKDELFRAVLERALEGITRYDERLLALTEADVDRLPRAILQHNMQYLSETPYFWRLLAWENLGGGRHVASMPDFRQRGYQHLCKLYQRGQHNGIYHRRVSFETFILVLTSVSFFYQSNQQTMSRSLGVNMADPAVQRRFIREIDAALRSEAAPAKRGKRS